MWWFSSSGVNTSVVLFCDGIMTDDLIRSAAMMKENNTGLKRNAGESLLAKIEF